MSLTDKFTTAGKYGLAGLVGATGGYYLNEAVKAQSGWSNLYSNVSDYLLKSGGIVDTTIEAGSKVADLGLGLLNLYAGLASTTYNIVLSSFGGASTLATGGLYGITAATLGITAATLSGLAVGGLAAYLTYRLGEFAIKKTFKLTDYIIKAPFKLMGKVARKIFP